MNGYSIDDAKKQLANLLGIEADFFIYRAQGVYEVVSHSSEGTTYTKFRESDLIEVRRLYRFPLEALVAQIAGHHMGGIA